METQRRLFEIIRMNLPRNSKLVEVIADLLDIRPDSAYRRIRGEKELSFRELKKVCATYNISMDAMLLDAPDYLTMIHKPHDLTRPDTYVEYISEIAQSIRGMKMAQTRKIFFASEDIPIYHFMDYPELTSFRFYSWFQTVQGGTLPFDKFMSELIDFNVLKEHCKEISEAYEQIPSTEMWTTISISPILRQISYFYEIGGFADKETPILLCNQLKNMIKKIESWACYQRKGEHSDVEFNLYKSLISPENSFAVNTVDGISFTVLKLFPVNNIATHNPILNQNINSWIKSTLNKSELLSGVSALSRCRFFTDIHAEIDSLIERVENGRKENYHYGMFI